ncbi:MULTISPECIES: efflux RND transporter periplasmic adaptor subunit [Flavobacteriaceae]|jgi:Cu(I)/Ag(I) efflux system membrane fusion protein|uniref:Cation efflux system protein CusB n=1 Tax=Arenibacter algicola TaxID=616991 RepID=A0A221UWX6_9FLAO|nr:efflux RND transporter periplasmic adaptor subunit [Arenibacter algicola]ASO05832.1 cation efflux system protein CusB [Arenibacter algicola]
MTKETKKIISIAVTTLFVGLLLGWFFFGGSKNTTVDEHQHDSEMVGETIWTCSMHPQIRQNEPGDCPICGMELIPLESDDSSELDPMAISMSPTAMQLANVATAIVGKTKPVKSVRLNGKVKADERSVYSQSSHIPGRIEKLMVNFTGEYVNKGQVIASIYSPDLVNAQEELFEARKIVETEPLLFNSAKEKLKNWKLTDKQIAQILESGVVKEELPILADISGYVTEKKVNLGDYVMKGMAIYEIANLNNVWILFDVYESDMAWVKKGDAVNFTVQSLPGESFKGKISYIDPVIDPMTRVAKARVEINNSGLKLKPEMFVSGTVEAELPIKSEAIIVPKTAVMWTGQRSVVYIKNTTAKGVNFMMRDVTLGPALGDGFVVNDGLQEGEEIAINGTFSIDASAQLAGKPSMMNPEGGPAMTGHNHGGGAMPATNGTPNKTAAKKVSVSQKAKDALKPLFTEYLSMKDALTNDNLENAKKAGSNILKTVDGLNMALFTGESHNVWMGLSSDLKNTLQHVQHFKTLEEIRKAFQQVSNIIIGLETSFNPNDEALYVMHCPMANNNKGADWVSTSKEVKNPYYGQSMPTCGEVTKEIK